MKTKYLDKKNCHALLPQGQGSALIKRLEKCLQGINSKQGDLNGSIDRLITFNEKTQNRARGSQRYCRSSIDIAYVSHLSRQLINVQSIQRPGVDPAKLHTNFVYENGMTWKTIVPLQFLLKGWGDANSGHQAYVHTISRNMSALDSPLKQHARSTADEDNYYYAGITGRNWLHRFSEHIGEIRRGSGKRFHAAWRQNWGEKDAHFVSALMDINLTYEDAMKWEELEVDRIASDSYGLNMIPGGFKGLKFLHKHRMINSTSVSLEERNRAIAAYVQQNPRKGIPNPFIAELWKDDAFYLKNIEARAKTLSPDQVRAIRKLSNEGRTVAEIVASVGALNERQVKNVIAGKTYQRIR